jgi:sugar/nucleoside kinase (ribokinase family)
MSAQSILIVGSMAFDDLEFPRPIVDPQQPSRSDTKFRDVVGGAATYAALAASTYAPSRIVAVVGSDFPAETLDRLKARDVDTTGVEHAAGKTFRWSGRYHDDLVNRDTLDTQLNVFANFEPQVPESYRTTPLVLLGNIHPALQLSVLDQVERPELVVADTMNFWITGEPDALAKVMERIDLLVINDEEARLLSGIHNIARAADDILKRGPKGVIIKRGEYGSLFFDAGGVFSAPALPLQDIVDPTGAGDSFAGGLVGYLARHAERDHHTMRRAMIHGTATASFCVEGLGTAGLTALTHSDVNQRVQRIRDLAHISAEPG